MQSIIPLLPLTLQSSAAVTPCRFVTLAGALASGASRIAGVARSDTHATDEYFTVDIFGVASVEAGALVNNGDTVGSDIIGRAVTVVPGQLKTAVIAGGAAGPLTVAGLGASDTLVSVNQFILAADPALSLLKQAVIAGGAAGNHTVTGILTTDTLVSVHEFVVAVDTGTDATGNKIASVADLTAECSITATNTINNTSGTDTSGSQLLVTYSRAAANVSKVSSVADLSAQFTVSAAATVTNAGGTDTTGDKLLVVYRQNVPVGGIALSAASAAGQFIQVLLLPQAHG